MDATPEALNFAECRRGDPDRWLTTLFAPDSRRGGLLALYAFQLEIARTAEQVSEPMLGHIRLQWWRETLEGVRAGTPRRHPVAEGLAAAGAATWPEADFSQLINARERDLDPSPFPDMTGLLEYVDGTNAPLMRLAALALGSVLDAETSRYAGQAYGLIGLLRAVPFHAAQNRVMMPLDLLGRQGLAPEQLLRESPDGRAFAVFSEVGAEARRLLVMARRRPVQRAALPALLPLTLAELQLARLELAGFDPASRLPPVSPLRQHMRLVWAGLRKKF